MAKATEDQLNGLRSRLKRELACGAIDRARESHIDFAIQSARDGDETHLDIELYMFRRPGIYAIVDLDQPREYIGQSKDVSKRTKFHMRHIYHGDHPNPYIRNEFAGRWGRTIPVVLQYCTRYSLDRLEKRWIALRDPSCNRACGGAGARPELLTKHANKHSREEAQSALIRMARRASKINRRAQFLCGLWNGPRHDYGVTYRGEKSAATDLIEDAIDSLTMVNCSDERFGRAVQDLQDVLDSARVTEVTR